MFWGISKTVDCSVKIEIGITDISKRSLEPVRRSKLSVKLGNDMTVDEVRVLAQKNIQITFSPFAGLENYILLNPDTKLVYHIPGSDEPFPIAKYKNS